MGKSDSVPDDTEPLTRCFMCLLLFKELCQDDVCRNCHTSVTWDDCTSGTWNAKILLQNGHTKEEVLAIYPDAKI